MWLPDETFALRGLWQEEREDVKTRLEDAFGAFATRHGYELAGSALASAVR
jgi:hypothetical protein